MSDDPIPAVYQDIVQLRRITQLTGAIHEAQLLQLKHWPHVLFDIREHSIEHNGDSRTLKITMKLASALPKGEQLSSRIVALEKWVRELLGDDWALSLWYRSPRGKKVLELHRGQRLSPIPTPPPQYGGSSLDFKRYQKLDAEAAAKAVSEDLKPLGDE